MKNQLKKYFFDCIFLILLNIVFRAIGWISDLSYLSTFFVPLFIIILSDVFRWAKRKWRLFCGKPALSEKDKVRDARVQMIEYQKEDAWYWFKGKMSKWKRTKGKTSP